MSVSQIDRVREFYSRALPFLERDRRAASSRKIAKVERVVLNALRKHLRPHICASAIGPASFRPYFTGDLTFLSRKEYAPTASAQCQRSHDPAAFVLRRAIPLLSVRFATDASVPRRGRSRRLFGPFANASERLEGTRLPNEWIYCRPWLAQEITIVDEVQSATQLGSRASDAQTRRPSVRIRKRDN